MVAKGAICSRCGKSIGRNNKSGLCSACYHSQYSWLHRDQINDRIRKWKVAYRETHREQIADYAKFERFRLKLETIKAYGGKCACCGETEPLFLTIDHINGDGKQDREKYRAVGVGFYRHLRRMGWPKDRYRLLCFNCNAAKGFWGICPHELQELLECDTALFTQDSFRLWCSQGVGKLIRNRLTSDVLEELWKASDSCTKEAVTIFEMDAWADVCHREEMNYV